MKATNNPDMMQWIRVKREQIYGSSQVLLVVLWLIPALNLGSCLHSAYSGHKVSISVWDKEKMCIYFELSAILFKNPGCIWSPVKIRKDCTNLVCIVVREWSRFWKKKIFFSVKRQFWVLAWDDLALHCWENVMENREEWVHLELNF